MMASNKILYILIALALAIPLKTEVELEPAYMETSKKYFETIEGLETDGQKIFALVSFDWGPNTAAENRPQTELTIEHLMRKRIPFAVMSAYSLASPFLESIPSEIAKNLQKEFPGQSWEYGKDWVNLGYQFGYSTMVKGIASSDDFQEFFKTDTYGTPIEDLPAMSGVLTLKDVDLFAEFTGLTGVFNLWLQFLQKDGYRPLFLHGCTSVTIPEAFIYFASGQLTAMFEGIAGAAYYEKLLSEDFPSRKKGTAIAINTGVSYAHLIIIAFIIIGNLAAFLKRK